jgi:hypothetical protein
VHGFTASRAAKVDPGHLSTSMVPVQDRWAGLAREPAITPSDHHHQHVDELRASVGEVVLETRTGIVLTALENTVLDEVIEPLGEYLAGDSEIGLNLVEAVDSREHIAQHQG